MLHNEMRNYFCLFFSLYNIFIVLHSVFMYETCIITELFNVFSLPYIFLWLQKEHKTFGTFFQVKPNLVK